jgi:hypothetical protein
MASIVGSLFSRLPFHHNPKTEERAGQYSPSLKLMFFIVDWESAPRANAVISNARVQHHLMLRAKGTANSDMLDLLGIGATEKALLMCLEEQSMVPVLLHDVRAKLGAHGAGAGIAFTVPLSGINTPLLSSFLERKTMDEKHEKRIEIKSDLILCVMNQGFSDEVMACAREAGARGGTVINARGLNVGGAVKFFGVSVQEERELLLILTGSEEKTAIMEAISDKHGLKSKANAIVFSLPVDQVMSLNLLQ